MIVKGINCITSFIMGSIIKIIVGISVVTCLISSCAYPCKKASSYLELISFTDIERDTIIFRRFSKATNFISQQDSFILTRQNINYQRQQDTVIIFQLPGGNDIITSDYEYEVFLPKVNRLFRISGIVENVQYGTRSTYKTLCGNTIASYKVNGQLMNDNQGNQYIYLKK